MRHGSLFSGIGGFDLAAQWMGWTNVFHCEINDFCRTVLHHYWPDAIQYTDIKTTDFKTHANTIDILTGGFPCQPYSTAGKRKGKEDERHLWPEMLRAIREIQPRWIVGENVRGLTNWNGGMVFDEVQADLEAEGYEILPFLLPACAVNAPHRRDRIWFIAHANRNVHEGRLDTRRNTTEATGSERKDEQQKGWNENGQRLRVEPSTSGEDATNSGSLRQQRSGRTKRQMRSTENADWKASWVDPNGGWPTEPPVCNGDDGFSSRLDATTISRKEWIENSLTGAGNAVVPQVVYQIFKAIEKCGS